MARHLGGIMSGTDYEQAATSSERRRVVKAELSDGVFSAVHDFHLTLDEIVEVVTELFDETLSSAS